MLQYLKRGTDEIHREVEKTNLAKNIIDHSITIKAYKKLLIQNYYSYQVIEKELVRNIHLIKSDLNQFINLDKCEALLKDIRQLDPSFTNTIHKDIEFSIVSESEAIGALYVIQGSMLGGLLISKNLAKCSKLIPIKTHHFFQSNPKDVMNRWKTFSEIVNNIIFSDTDKEKALNSAQKSFLVFNACQTKLFDY